VISTRLGKELSVSQDTDLDAREAEASARLASVFDVSMIDALLADAMASGTPIEGANGLLNTMTKAVLERALEVEMTHELGYERAESGRSWFGEFSQVVIRPRTVSTSNGGGDHSCAAGPEWCFRAENRAETRPAAGSEVRR
jgi:putative transposase